MGKSRGRGDPRRIAAAQVHGIASGWASRSRRDLDRAGALAEIREVTTDPQLLAETAATLVDSDHWYRDAAVGLVVDAGADPADVVRLAEEHRTRTRGFDLGAMARGLSATVDDHVRPDEGPDGARS